MKSQSARRKPRVIIPRPHRVRRIGNAGFAWLDARLKHEGWLEVLSPDALAVYTFLCLAANREGVSWYRKDRIARTLGIPEDQLHLALRRLYELDLVAYRPFARHASDGFHQILALPQGGPPPLPELLASHLEVRS